MVPRAMSPTGGRSWRARCRARESTFLRCPPGPRPSAQRNRKPEPLPTLMSQKQIHEVGIIMNGVTGRMGLNQHLRRSIWAIIKQGGVSLGATEAIMPKPILVGRSSAKLEAISAECGGLPWTTKLDEALADPKYSIYFDSQTTD